VTYSTKISVECNGGWWLVLHVFHITLLAVGGTLEFGKKLQGTDGDLKGVAAAFSLTHQAAREETTD
jgi:hypothetical protein